MYAIPPYPRNQFLFLVATSAGMVKGKYQSKDSLFYFLPVFSKNYRENFKIILVDQGRMRLVFV